ncbi:MAG: type II toxin-antitoxin system RelE/ParE family toxin [Sphingomonadales bacterium]|nr:type II toxin-antitoxin system RelE/ParE family toxin [Sphingomonadales bacterium]
MAWTIEIERGAERELDKLGPQNARRILRFLRDRLAPLEDPRSIGEALKGAKPGSFWKYRVGDYRIIANIEDAEIRILNLRIGNRRDVYRAAVR